jgi:hypothetical protein
VVAGNYFGVGVDGTSLPTPSADYTPDLLSLPSTGGLRLGSDFNGVSDALEGNLIVGVPGSQLVDAGKGLTILVRGNRMVDCGFAAVPFADGSNTRTYEEYYASAILDPTAPVPAITSFDNGVLVGTLPGVYTDIYPLSEVDVYLVDPVSETNAMVVLPGTYLKSFRDNGAGDTDATLNQFSVNLSSVSIPAGSKLAIAVNYSTDTNGFTFAGLPLTGPLSAAFAAPAGSLALNPPTLGPDGITLTWTGGKSLFLIQHKLKISDPWVDLNKGSARTVTLPLDSASGFFRVVDGQVLN